MWGKIVISFLLTGAVVGEGISQGNSVKLIQTKYSKKAVRLVLKNMGKKVGSGTSLSLLTAFEKKSRARTGLKFSLSKKSLQYVSVGDELYFSGTYKDNHVSSTVQSTSNYAGSMHYAIVVGIKDDNTLIIAHQNMNDVAPAKARLMISELKVEDASRYENINVYGLWPKSTRVKPEKVLRKDGKVYQIQVADTNKTCTGITCVR
jgi:hypothetical protein